jgi:hypothetical protein
LDIACNLSGNCVWFVAGVGFALLWDGGWSRGGEGRQGLQDLCLAVSGVAQRFERLWLRIVRSGFCGTGQQQRGSREIRDGLGHRTFGQVPNGLCQRARARSRGYGARQTLLPCVCQPGEATGKRVGSPQDPLLAPLLGLQAMPIALRRRRRRDR